MATTLSFKDGIDPPQWRPIAPLLGNSAAGQGFAWDHRNDDTRVPLIFNVRSATGFDVYNPITDDWLTLASPALAGTFGAGATCVFNPSQGPSGTIAAGSTTTAVVLSTALPAAVAPNQLGNKGDGKGYRIRIVSPSTGKTELRTIVGNTGGTTPTIYLDSALSFTPALNDVYEINSGRVYLLSAGTVAAGVWKYYDVATNSFSASLGTTNLPAAISGDSALLALSELHVPYNRKPGEGFLAGGATYNGGVSNCIQATAAAAGTITGSGMPSDLAANEYRNFQVRIVEDTVTPASVGQRRVISSHTAGAAGVFTLAANWTTTPSASAKFVIENNDDLILLRSSATTTVYTYSVSGNTWSTATFGAGPAVTNVGCIFEQSFGILRDPAKGQLHSNCFFFRGGGSSAIDILDIAAAAAGTWSGDIAYGNKGGTTPTTGTSGAYDPATLEGKYLHINLSGSQRFAKFDMKNRTLLPGTYLKFPQSTAVTGQKLAMFTFIDGATKVAVLHACSHTQTYAFSQIIQS